MHTQLWWDQCIFTAGKQGWSSDGIWKTPGIQSKATSSLFPIKMIAKLERTQRNAQQNMEQTQIPTIGAQINNNRIAALEWTAAQATGGLRYFIGTKSLPYIMLLLKHKNCEALMEAS